MVTTHCSQTWSKLEMICKVRQTIEKYNLLDDVHSLAVGVSGGADSMCLLEILSKLKQEYDIILRKHKYFGGANEFYKS